MDILEATGTIETDSNRLKFKSGLDSRFKVQESRPFFVRELLNLIDLD